MPIHSVSSLEPKKPTTLESSSKQENIEHHSAWHRNIDMTMASLLLIQKPPFSFILSPLPQKETYLLTYVREDSIITSTIFNSIEGQWHYRNGDDHICSTLQDLICKAMHCHPEDCKPMLPSSVADLKG